MYMQNGIERRVFERFKVTGPAYAAVGSKLDRMGHIINISRSGVAFSYIKHSSDPPWLGETRIQISDNIESLCDMPFISISDTSGDVADPHSSVEIRYHRGRFGPLTHEQLDALIGFLEEKTHFELIKN